MEIRYITSSDDKMAISRIYEESWKYAYKNIVPQDYLDSIEEGRWVATLDICDWSTLLCVYNGKYVGTCSFSKSRFEDYPDCGEIISIYFLPEFIGKGYGKELLETAVSELEKQGYKEMFLWVLDDNISAKKFYEKQGFVPTENCIYSNIGGKELCEVMYTYKVK